MACMYSNVESPRRDLLDSPQLNNWILDSVATCHMTLDISYFLSIYLVVIDKYIEVAYANLIIAKKRGSQNKNAR